jgi:signal transduction histidine kinase/CheY-like chemotaxis protein/HAMP domain-containing protein
MMANNLTSQVRNIAEVTTAVANGDLTRKITVNVKGEILELKNTINTMVDQLSSFASEVTRVSREVGTEGKLGGQAHVKGTAGTWKDLTDNVNHMANNLTTQVRNIAEVTTAVASGDLTKKITVDVRGEILELKNTINTMVDQLNSFASEVIRVAREVGIEGKLGGQAYVQGAAGTWKDLTDNVNHMAGNLTSQVRNIAAVTTAVANGDLSKKITVDAKGEIFELKNTINIMVDQLSSFAAEVTRVAREVGTEGKLGGQAIVKGVGGIWKDFTDNVNQMASNLTEQVRSIAKVVTAVAQGDLKKKLMVQAKGEVAALSETINNMIDTLATFAVQVTSVAREVGVEGRLGGQASVPGAAGTWKDLTDNVNQLAANLTNQVRAISKVARAVTTGDLTRTIHVEAQGEVAALKDIINEMIYNLKDTTLKNAEQDWLKTNLAKFTRILQGQKNLEAVARLILSELAPMVSSQHGVFYINDTTNPGPIFKLLAAYAYKERKHVSTRFALGEGLVGQCAYEKERILLTSVPTDYIQICSGLGESKPLNIVVLPVLFEGQVKAVIELGSFGCFTRTQLALLDQLPEIIGIVLNSIETNSRTEDLLKQSQSMAQELRSQQEELKQTNEELEEKAKLLATQNAEVAQKNREIEIARRALEEKAEQLALTSKYKSEFLANMSHELRTPLNSLLVLSQHLAENSAGNLTSKQIEFAKTISTSGMDLLNLINDILDLSKIESGVATVDIEQVNIREICEDVERMFRHIAEDKHLSFNFSIAPNVPYEIESDGKRLRQVLKNFLSNAYKFTKNGGISLNVSIALQGWSNEHPILSRADRIIAFSVIDTGIGIPADKQQIIFEAFQQADGTTSRKYGGCGLGLSISKEIAWLLGGEITLQSEPGKGSVFTFYLPRHHLSAAATTNKQVQGRDKQTLKPIIIEEENRIRNLLPFHEVNDDRNNLQANDTIILFTSNDTTLVQTLVKLAREGGTKVLLARQFDETFTMAQYYEPHAIILDVNFEKINSLHILKGLKNHFQTRHIPIFVINGEIEQRDNYLQEGVKAYLMKPWTPEVLQNLFKKINDFIENEKRHLLIIADNRQKHKVLQLLKDQDIVVSVANTGTEALNLVKKTPVDCMVLTPNLCDMDIEPFIKQINDHFKEHHVPLIIYSQEENIKKQKIFNMTLPANIRKVSSPERLLDETALYLHRVHNDIPLTKRNLIDKLHQSNAVLLGKKILIVDDDVRNIFAMTSALEDYGVDVCMAEKGKEAIQLLNENPRIDAVLMDIMMPDMDGYETIRKIRTQIEFKKLPILAITAKAMKEDREKCLEAGASDYLSKPIIFEQLLSMLRVWLYR